MSTTLLLTHLQNPNPKVDLSTLSAALAHHLTVELPGPISLAAATVSSPFFLAYPPTNERLQALVTTFQHAAQLRHKALVKKAGVGWSLSRAIFSESVEKGLRNWAHAVIRGMQGGRGVIRLACSVGLLLGITGLQRSGFTDGRVEDEIIISLAEVMDDFSAQTGDWEKEFRPPMNETVLSLTLILASQSLPLIPKPKLKTLPMSLLANFLASTIDSAFHHGNFLKPIPRSTTSDLFHVPPNSSFALTIHMISTSPTMLAMAKLSKLAATILGILIDSSKTGLQDSLNMMHTFRNTAHRIERSWKGSKLATIHSDDELSPETRDLSTGIWLLLKTLLFSIVMVADSVLGAAVYARPSQSLGKSSPQELAECILLTLSHIAFVVSELGGVTVTATGNDPGFAELRKVFYLALDVLAFQEKDTSTLNYCELFVKKLVADLGVHACTLRATGAFDQAKIAYTLACIEQLVPSLGVSCLADDVWGLCVPYLVDPSHRETFESAHSVILSIFAFHAQQRCGGDLFETQHDERITESTSTSPDATQFVHRMIPYYAQCLIENSQDGRLSTAQLRLAYAALVKSACSFSSAIAWYCISVILDTIRDLPWHESSSQERLHRLHLMLISSIPALSLPLMLRALEEVRIIVTDIAANGTQERRRQDLVDALFGEILDGVGDRSKEIAMAWWYHHRENFARQDIIGKMDNTVVFRPSVHVTHHGYP